MSVLTDKRYVQFDYLSRYSGIPIYYHKDDDKYVAGTDRWISDNTLYSEYIIRRNDTYDLLALRYYNNPTLYWVICAFNRIADPFEPPVIGSKIKIPTLANIEFLD